MNVLIVSTNRNAYPMPVLPIGACMIAEAAERSGHAVKLLDLMFEDDPVHAIASELKGVHYDVIGLSVRNIDNNDMRKPKFYVHDIMPLIDTIRENTDAPIVLGGAAFSVMPDEILQATGASYAVIGDGEEVFPRLLDRLSAGESMSGVPGVAYRENGTARKNPCIASGFSDAFLAPDYRRWVRIASYLPQLTTVPIQTKIGCGFQCVYCTYRKIEGSTYRFSDPEHVADAVETLAASGLRDVEFVDSVFNAPYDHAMAVCESLVRRKHRARLQSIELNPASFDDVLVRTMKRAGFVGMGMTVESASDAVLQGLRKGFTAKEVHAAADSVRRNSVPCLWIFLLGGPGETEATVRETLRFAETAIRPSDAVFMNIGIRIYPGTELEQIARQQGLLSKPSGEMLEPVFYVSPDVNADWMLRQVRNAMNKHMSFINSDAIAHPSLPRIHRAAYRLGVRSPLWRYTRFIRRGMRLMGMEA